MKETLYETQNTIYHEKQRKKMCGLHTLNNLLQKPQYSSNELNKIGFEINQFQGKWMNYYRNMCWGDYDVNVLIVALQNSGVQVDWFDVRKDVKDIDLTKVFGIIINYEPPIEVPKFWYKILHPSLIKPLSHLIEIKGRHWYGIRKIDDEFYNLDSKLIQPYKYKNSEELLNSLKNIVKEYDGKILLCYQLPSM
ncbi:hypothetical protein CONCODRAFT_77149 [Conidiobolus coronatus NRRL 28638]|uniref:ubiquitinyl hydrolase 1 n=1 Tax=Conidiobolus coronatus (strain ATCC 28846 / CBS 209.66 / NRRL 28638) TaxID=796925 RepID=A0A137PFX7_CONC2|nr:hypothetical protein CONCODRAFT_77149 [Conidiobolus coronatus NRRL 28638]|eukprot:KXN73906.1 hypothetical protein CONCODRAFT_77149 [Conidiobolus coronatus NRRL 28638]